MSTGDDELRRPGAPTTVGVLLLRWFTLFNGGLSLWWFVSEQSLTEKVVALSLLAAGIYTVSLVRFTANRERDRQAKKVRQLELRILQLEGRAGTSRMRRAA